MTQRITIPLPVMQNADAHVEPEENGNGYNWFVRIKFGDAIIGAIWYSHGIHNKPSEEEVARVAAEHMKKILFPEHAIILDGTN